MTEGEKHPWDGTCNLGVHPDQGWNQRPFDLCANAQTKFTSVAIVRCLPQEYHLRSFMQVDGWWVQFLQQLFSINFNIIYGAISHFIFL